MGKRKAYVALIIVAAIGGLYTYSSLHNQDKKSFATVTVEKGTISKQATAVGKIVPAHSISIKSQIDGIVGKIYVKVGERVKKGQPLIKLLPNPTPQALTAATTELMQAEAALESAQKTLDNLKSLIKQKVIPNNYDQYIQAVSDLKTKRAEVQQKKQNLELIQSGEANIGKTKLTSTIYAPINGTVLDLKVEVGEPIISTESSQSATEMMSLADMNHLIFKGSVSEHDAAQLKSGMPAIITVAPYPKDVIPGKLSEVAIQSESLNSPDSEVTKAFDNGFEVEASDLAFPSSITLRSGFSASAKITLKQAKDVLVIPERALKFDGDTPMVLIADDSKKGYHSQKVTLGLSNGIKIQVTKGVKLGEKLVDASMVGNNE
ncbi:efflux RND transporter periplasmic adaptor subunit [Vibrio sp. S4M6]|uniref:efflux RND transporter periplasmic adaptor subunit n=1 Tax=Vibrio sinus TaxID=2946865 RepID=UPI00202A6249|nr:efflux RND transporter periplasmic adaptor subunit [Vibrio sinus]MCL9781634.1 efflux RND transporter periplasmic adaptor subunit [Vibrio sinus]